MVSRALNFLTDRIHELPVIVMMPHSRCNCRCIMCDIWKANAEKKELSAQEIEQHLDAFRKLRVREVVLSGGEALMHPDLWTLCQVLHRLPIKITLLSTGLLLEKYAEQIVTHVDEIIVSLDGSREVHDRIRNVPQAFDKLAQGVRKLRQLEPKLRIMGRCVLQQQNYYDLPNIIKASKEIGLQQISFLPADVSTSAFNHSSVNEAGRVSNIALTLGQADQFAQVVEETFVQFRSDFDSKFVAESIEKFRRIPRYYRAIAGAGSFEAPSCNAPWVSAVLESDGRLMPCFFHEAYGSIYDHNFLEVLNSKKAVAFRKQLKIEANSTCQKCVCSLRLPMI